MTMNRGAHRVMVGEHVSLWGFTETGRGYARRARVTHKRLLPRQSHQTFHPVEITFEDEDGATETVTFEADDILEVIA